MLHLYLSFEEIREFEDWIESELENYTLENYYLLPEDIQEEIEIMYAQGEFYVALEHVNAELDKLNIVQKSEESE